MANYISGAEWAAQVKPTQPHGLADIDAVVIDRAQLTIARAEQQERAERPERVSRRRLSGTLQAIAMLTLLFGPVAAATVFWNRSDYLYASYDFSADFAFPAAAVGFTLGFVLVLMGIRDWWRRGRRRDGFTIGISVGVLICAVLTLWQGYRAGEGPVVTVYLAPAWLGALAAVVTILAVGLSKPVPQSQPGDPDVDISILSLREQNILLDDRKRALEILKVRGMLPDDVDVDALNNRPLGQLA